LLPLWLPAAIGLVSYRAALERLPLQATIVALVAFGVFAATLPHELVWDDHSLIALIDSHSSLADLLRAEFQMEPDVHMGYYRPVVLLSLWVDAQLVGAIPWSFHLTNVLLHTAVSLLVLLFFRRLMRGSPFAAAGALLFALHPAHTEAVAFVSGRTDLWAALFVLVAALLWVRVRDAGSASDGAAYVGSLVALLAAVLSKEVALMLPPTLLVADALLPAAVDGWWRRNRRWILGWAAVLATAALLRWTLAEVPFGLATGTQDDQMIALFSKPLLVPQALVLYLRLLVIPWPLNAYYGIEDLEFGGISILVATGLGVACVALARGGARWHGLLPAAWTLLFLVPVLGVVRISSAPMAERFLYLPSVGFALLVAVAFERGARRVLRPVLLWSACAIVAAGFLAATLTRSAVWQDGTTLFADLARTSPVYVAQAHSNMGFRYHQQGLYEQALESYGRATALQPAAPEILTNVGASLLALDRLTEAEDAYRRAVASREDYPEAHFGLGAALLRQGRLDEAEVEARRLDDLSPRFSGALRREIHRQRRE